MRHDEEARFAVVEQDELYDTAQRDVIACLLSSPDDVASAMEHLREDFFENPQLALIYAAIAAVARSGEKPTVIAVSHLLEQKGQLTRAGGVQELFDLHTSGADLLLEAPTPLYVQALSSYAVKAKLRADLQDLVPVLRPDSGVSSAEALARVRAVSDERQFDLAESSFVSTTEGVSESYRARIAEREKQAAMNAGQAGILGVPTSLETLNDITSGWLPGQFITVAARTGIGKSVLCVNQAVAAAQAGLSVLLFSLEMSQSELEDRIVSSLSGVPLKALKNGHLSDRQRDWMMEALAEMERMNITIDSSPYVTMDMIRARSIKEAQSEHGVDLVIVDYLQLIQVPSPSNSRERDVAGLSRELKILAKTLGVPVITAAQMNRPRDEEEAQRAPGIQDIRESNAIAQDSDIVIILHRVPSADSGTPRTQVIVGKHRNGASGDRIQCHSNLAYSLLREVDSDEIAAEQAAFDEEAGVSDDQSVPTPGVDDELLGVISGDRDEPEERRSVTEMMSGDAPPEESSDDLSAEPEDDYLLESDDEPSWPFSGHEEGDLASSPPDDMAELSAPVYSPPERNQIRGGSPPTPHLDEDDDGDPWRPVGFDTVPGDDESPF